MQLFWHHETWIIYTNILPFILVAAYRCSKIGQCSEDIIYSCQPDFMANIQRLPSRDSIIYVMPSGRQWLYLTKSVVVSYKVSGGILQSQWWYLTKSVVVSYKGSGGILQSQWWYLTKSVVVSYKGSGGILQRQWCILQSQWCILQSQWWYLTKAVVVSYKGSGGILQSQW